MLNSLGPQICKPLPVTPPLSNLGSNFQDRLEGCWRSHCLTRQYKNLVGTDFATIDLKEYALELGQLKTREKGSQDALLKSQLGFFMSKDDSVRKSRGWELPTLSRALSNYAALDVHGSRLVFEKMSETPARDLVLFTSPVGSRIALLTQIGGEIAPYGTISEAQPSSLSTPFGVV